MVSAITWCYQTSLMLSDITWRSRHHLVCQTCNCSQLTKRLQPPCCSVPMLGSGLEADAELPCFLKHWLVTYTHCYVKMREHLGSWHLAACYSQHPRHLVFLTSHMDTPVSSSKRAVRCCTACGPKGRGLPRGVSQRGVVCRELWAKGAWSAKSCEPKGRGLPRGVSQRGVVCREMWAKGAWSAENCEPKGRGLPRTVSQRGVVCREL